MCIRGLGAERSFVCAVSFADCADLIVKSPKVPPDRGGGLTERHARLEALDRPRAISLLLAEDPEALPSRDRSGRLRQRRAVRSLRAAAISELAADDTEERPGVGLIG